MIYCDADMASGGPVVGQKVDVLDTRNNAWYPGKVIDVVKNEGRETLYKVTMGHDDSWEEEGVVGERLAVEGSMIPRWRLFRPSNEIEIRVSAD